MGKYTRKGDAGETQEVITEGHTQEDRMLKRHKTQQLITNHNLMNFHIMSKARIK